MNVQFPELKNWFNAYLHQDFDLVYGSPDAAMDAFMSEASAEDIKKLSRDITEILQHEFDEDKLQDIILHKLDCCYYYPSEWDSGDSLLHHLNEMLNR